MTWQTHLRQHELLRRARAQQYEFCRLRGHDVKPFEMSPTYPSATRCERCGSVNIPVPAGERA
jgi:hypothetical protein